jgi:plastocyanin
MPGTRDRTFHQEGRRRAWLLVLFGVALAVLALGCNSGGSSGGGLYGGGSPTTTAATPGTTQTPASGTGGAGAQVTLSNFAFAPAMITVKVGDSVTWTNKDSTTHTVTADDKSFASGDLANGATFSFTFAKAGTFPYHCSIHPSMTGTVVVQ